jgi:hypothetical protein
MSEGVMLKMVDMAVAKYPDRMMLLHYRKATQGGKTQANCHPYPISDKIEDLKKLNIECKYAIAHNGVLTTRSRPERKDYDLVDTQEYILDYIAPLHEFLTNEHFVAFWGDTTSSRFAILEPDNNCRLVGKNWYKDGEFVYSNRSYVIYPKASTPVATNKPTTTAITTTGKTTMADGALNTRHWGVYADGEPKLIPVIFNQFPSGDIMRCAFCTREFHTDNLLAYNGYPICYFCLHAHKKRIKAWEATKTKGVD